MKSFGLSTHLYHEQALTEAHLVEIAEHGFGAVEVFATRSHFDYHDPAAVRSLKTWLDAAGLALHSVHAPITDVFANGRGRAIYSTATRKAEARAATLREAAAALAIAREIPFKVLVVHLGVPLAWDPGPDDNVRDAAIRSIEALHALAEEAGVTVALEVMGNELSTPDALVEILERSFDGAGLGICMDVGHAHLLGDTAESIETASEYLVTTHIHDNRKKTDDHLVPFQGTIDWAATIMAFEKIGYDGVLMYEVAGAESPRAVLARAVSARTRIEALMNSFRLSTFQSGEDADG